MSDEQNRGKAGISWPVQEGTSDPVAKFFGPDSKLSWHWNWNKHWQGPLLPNSSEDLQINAEFVPMIWSPDLLNDGNELQPGWKYILGFNEPDHGDSSVADKKTPEVAAQAWIRVAALRTDPEQKLVSPAVAGSVQWLKNFLTLIPPGTMPEYLAVHLYTTTFEDFVAKLEMYYDTFGLPIFLTEFAMQRTVVAGDNFGIDPNVPPPETQQQVHDFMGQTTKWLDETDWIVKYSWFGAVRESNNLHGVHPFNRLMDEHGEITNLGWQYIKGGHA
ncbi:hypothetical protein CI109_106916 [Kwoniella shandongensis]|uniref:Asl1-like glycosyl hydrolase catalytic domain-containing protein n=1 Tax=Kwoniella shandongensis TaxID=1734106 RepID=A0A5M6CC25_9TREE|nr:uncharacterized protein CI109_000829 [Kwoniella shandongensis]KAA5530649.1 hypothetical protein CI109_000829 [Kwoniella shandongensis]